MCVCVCLVFVVCFMCQGQWFSSIGSGLGRLIWPLQCGRCYNPDQNDIETGVCVCVLLGGHTDGHYKFMLTCAFISDC